ncbi:MAG: 50S ribosomal protein L10 [Alphaproteobacteria bacterium]|nr:50S ribosomal protein L10 [Alphaproteobacteria bacterium]
MDRTKKKQLIDSLHTALADTAVVVVTHQTGMTVEEVTDLRRQMRAAGANFRVTKNTFAQRAVTGTKFEPLKALFKGPTALAFSHDPVAAARVAVAYANKNDKLTLVAGALGERQLDVAGIKALASMPSLGQLRGKLVGLLMAPATKIAGVLQAPAGQLARLLSAHAAKGDKAA